MKFTKKYVLVPFDRYHSVKRLHADKLQKGGSGNDDDLDINQPTTLDKLPPKSKLSAKSKQPSLGKSKSKQPSKPPTHPPKPPPGIRNIHVQLGKEDKVQRQKGSFDKIRWRAI